MELHERFKNGVYLCEELTNFLQKQPGNGQEDQKRSGLHLNRNAWNIAHIREDDGHLRCARVVDCGTWGLFVDDGGEEKLVPYRKIYRSRHPNFYYEEPSNLYEERQPHTFERETPGNYLVEIQLNSNEPWKWHPGTVWTCHGYPYTSHQGPFGLVTVDLPTGQFKGIVPGHRIRKRSVYYGPVKAGDFTKEQVILPAKYCSGSTAVSPDKEKRLIENFNRNCAAKDHRKIATQITGNVLHFLGAFEERRFYQPPICNYTPREFNYRGVDLRDLLADPRRSFTHVDGRETDLFRLFPVNILKEILQLADTVQQNINRRVCAVWDLVTKASDQRMLHLSYRYNLKCWAEYPHEQYLNTACLFHCWTEWIKVLAISGSAGGSDDKLSCISRLVKRFMLERGRTPVDTVILSGMTRVFVVHHDLCWTKTLHTELMSFSAVCKTVIFMDLKLELVYENDTFAVSQFMTVSIDIPKGQVTASQDPQMTVYDLWARLDNSLPLVDDGDLQRLSDWINSDCDADTGGTVCDISVVVQHMQRADPRGNAPYTGDWLLEAVRGVNLKTLNKLAQHGLLALMRQDIAQTGPRQRNRPESHNDGKLHIEISF